MGSFELNALARLIHSPRLNIRCGRENIGELLQLVAGTHGTVEGPTEGIAECPNLPVSWINAYSCDFTIDDVREIVLVGYSWDFNAQYACIGLVLQVLRIQRALDGVWRQGRQRAHALAVRIKRSSSPSASCAWPTRRVGG